MSWSRTLFFLQYFARLETNDDFNPAVEKLEGLVCYQCESNASALLSLCDSEFFKTHKLQEKLDMIFQCPPEVQDYCIKKTVIGQGFTKTTRGCSGAYDSNNASVRSGCADVTEDDMAAEICLCTRNLCNESAWLHHSMFNCFLLSFVLNM